MPSPYITALETNRNVNQPVGFEQIEPGTVAEVVSSVVRTDRQPWRADFRGAVLDTTEDWQDPVVGAGGSVTQASSALTISSGVTANSVSYLRSRRTFKTPVRAQVSFTLSQRIANQAFYIEFVTADGNAFSRWKFDGTSATAAKIEVGTSATSQTLDAAATLATTATAQAVELDLAIDEVNFRSRAVDSNAAAVERGTRTNNLPHPDDVLYLQIRSVNGSTAPASTTNFVINYLIVQDVNELAVEVVGGRGGSTPSGSIPVQVANSPGVVVNSGNLTSAQAGSRGIWYDDTATVLAASGTYTGTSRDLFAAATGTALANTSYPKEVRFQAVADVAGALYIEVSRDNSTWRRVRGFATPAPPGGLVAYIAELSYVPTTRYVRAVYINSATAQTYFHLNTLLLAN